jgi:hypothetical protein
MFRDAPVEVWAMTKNPMMVPLPLPLFLLFGKAFIALLEMKDLSYCSLKSQHYNFAWAN